MGEGWHLDFHQMHFDLCSPDFYVKISVAGVAADKAKRKTRVIEDDWFPEWNEEFVFPLSCYELAVLWIQVYEYDPPGHPDFGGQTCLPVLEIRTGIRSLPLHDRKGVQFKHVRLLIEFEVT